MDNGFLVSLSAIALTITSPFLTLKSIPVILTLSRPFSDFAGILNIGFPLPDEEILVASPPTIARSLVILTSDTSV